MQVMSEYFEVMRQFLDHQTGLMQSLPAAEGFAAGDDADAAPQAASSHAVDGVAPMLDRIVEHDASRLVAHCHVSLGNDQFVRDHVLSGPVSDADPALLGLACVPFMASLELMAEACAVLAGRTDLGVVENVKAFDWIARRRRARHRGACARDRPRTQPLRRARDHAARDGGQRRVPLRRAAMAAGRGRPLAERGRGTSACRACTPPTATPCSMARCSRA